MRHWITSFQYVENLQWVQHAGPARLDQVRWPTHLCGMDDSSISATPAPWQQVALVCGKCSRKLRGGFGRKGKRDLAEVIKDAAKATGRRRAVRVLEVGCLGLCPKRAVSAIGMGQPGQVLVVPAGTDGMLVLTRLLGDQPSPDPADPGGP